MSLAFVESGHHCVICPQSDSCVPINRPLPLSPSRENIDNHLEGIGSELNSLQEQLLLGNFNIDSNVLMGVRLDPNYINKVC